MSHCSGSTIRSSRGQWSRIIVGIEAIRNRQYSRGSGVEINVGIGAIRNQQYSRGELGAASNEAAHAEPQCV
jgi:hypothetical protein